MLPNPLYAECVTRAAQVLGGLDRLARELYLAPRILERWVDGKGNPPTVVFLRLVDIVLGDDVPTSETNAPPEPRATARTTTARTSPST